MAVFATESDTQGSLDHIDSHRTLLLAAGPYVKRDYVSHTNASFPGLLRTIFELLRLPPLNLMDATAASVRICLPHSRISLRLTLSSPTTECSIHTNCHHRRPEVDRQQGIY